MIFAAIFTIPYAAVCKCAEMRTGMMLASTTLRLLVPYTFNFESTTPPAFFGSIAQVPIGWYMASVVLRTKSFHSALEFTLLSLGSYSESHTSLSGCVVAICRHFLVAAMAAWRS
jgi:hypothetical protein